MTKRGHDFTVIAQRDYNPREKESCGISVERFDFNSIFPKKKLSVLREIEIFLENLVETYRPDILHLNACVGWHAFVFLLFRKMFSVPVVLTIHAPIFYQNERNPLLERISHEADLIGCVSDWVVKETQKRIPSIKKKLRLIYNGLPIPEQTISPLSFSPPTLLIAGRFTIEKGFLTAIQAFSLIKRREARLIIAGGGEQKGAMEELIAAHQLEQRVLFTGTLRREEIPLWINQATLVLVPSYFESFGLIALEAMQMQRPVIASAVGGLLEIVCHGETGLLVPPHDSNALAEAVNALLEEPKKTRQMGKAGRKRAIDKFSLDEHIAGYENLYRGLL